MASPPPLVARYTRFGRIDSVSLGDFAESEVVHVTGSGTAGELDGSRILLDCVHKILERLVRRIGLDEENLVIGDQLGERRKFGVLAGKGAVDVADDEGRREYDQLIAVFRLRLHFGKTNCATAAGNVGDRGRLRIEFLDIQRTVDRARQGVETTARIRGGNDLERLGGVVVGCERGERGAGEECDGDKCDDSSHHVLAPSRCFVDTPLSWRAIAVSFSCTE